MIGSAPISMQAKVSVVSWETFGMPFPAVLAGFLVLLYLVDYSKFLAGEQKKLLAVTVSPLLLLGLLFFGVRAHPLLFRDFGIYYKYNLDSPGSHFISLYTAFAFSLILVPRGVRSNVPWVRVAALVLTIILAISLALELLAAFKIAAAFNKD